MMSSENIPPPSQPPDHNPHSGASSKPASSSQKTTQEAPAHPLKCPRCDSANTKFCYYNNYSLTQPRHFCKSCRRYWTKGGALRNVPIGGGCRKTKKLKPTATTTASCSSSEFRFLPTAPPPAAFEFQVGRLSLPRLHPGTAGVYTQFIASSTGAHSQQPAHPTGGGCFSVDLLGLGNYTAEVRNSGNSSSTNSSLSLAGGRGGGGVGDQTLTISSIESLSTINQEMHWKLQQQRLALIYGPSSSGMEHDDDDDNNNNNNQQEKATLIGGGGGGGGGIQLFKNAETTTAKKVEGVAGVEGPTLLCSHPAPTEWLFDQSQPNYGVITTTDTTNTTTNYNNNNNKYDDFNGVWTTQLHHHHHFSGLQ